MSEKVVEVTEKEVIAVDEINDFLEIIEEYIVDTLSKGINVARLIGELFKQFQENEAEFDEQSRLFILDVLRRELIEYIDEDKIESKVNKFDRDFQDVVNRHLTEQKEINDIENLLEEGYNVEQICKQFGFARKKVRKLSKIWENKGNTIGNEQPKEEEKDVKKKKMTKKQKELAEQKELAKKKEIDRQLKKAEEEELAKKITLQQEELAKKKELEELAVVEEKLKKEQETLNVIRDNIKKAQEHSIDKDVHKSKREDTTMDTEFCEYKRGDIIHVSNEAFDSKNGMIGKSRPAVVVQNDAGNRHSNNLIVAYVTSVMKKHTLPTHVMVNDHDVLRDSMILTEQLQTVNKEYVSYLGKLGDTTIREVDRALITSLALEDYIEKEAQHLNKRISKEELDDVYREMLNTQEDCAVALEENEPKVIEKEIIKEVIKEVIVEKEVVKESIVDGFKHLKVAEFYSDKFVYDVRDGVKLRRINESDFSKDMVQEGLSFDELSSLIEELQEIKKYMVSLQ